MPSIVDSLIVELGLDPSDFTGKEKDIAGKLAGFKRRSQQAARESEDAIRHLQEAFEDLVRKAITYAGSFLTLRSMVNFTKDVIESNRRLGIMADTMQESVTRISALGNTFERMGGSSQGIISVLDDWDRQMKSMEINAADPMQSQLLNFLNTLGQVGLRVSATDAAGKFRKPIDIIIEVVEKLSKVNAPESTKVALLMQGGFDRETAATMLRMSGNIRKELEETLKIYAVTPEQRAKTDAINRALRELDQRVKNLGQTTLVVLADGLMKVENALRSMFNFIGKALSDPNSPFYLPAVEQIKEYFRREKEGTLPSQSGGGGVSGQGALGGTVHGHPVDPYGGLTGQTLYEPMTGRMGGGVGGTSAMFGPGQHEGVDIMGKAGSPVYASRSGRIVRAPFPRGGLDQVLTIDHGDGTFSRYLHQGPANVQVGDQVSGGQMIGSSGHRNADHTHFEMWRGQPGARGSVLLNPKALYGWDKNNPAVGGRAVIARGPSDSDGPWSGRSAPVPFIGGFKSPISLRTQPTSSRTQTEINTVNVNTGADDASAIAGDIAKELKRQMRESLPSARFLNSKSPLEANQIMLEQMQRSLGAGQ